MRESCCKVLNKVWDKFLSFDKCLNLVCSSSFSLDISEMFKSWWNSVKFKADITLLYKNLDSLSSLLTIIYCKSLSEKVFLDITYMLKKNSD